jgi:hypothetical protein
VKNAVETVFADEVLRDFVLTLTFVFFSRWGASDEKYAQLVETFAFSVSADVPTSNTGTLNVPSAIPPAILADLSKSDNVRSRLLANKWLATLLLIQLVVQMPDLSETKKRARHSS